jgi:hypothetical protein
MQAMQGCGDVRRHNNVMRMVKRAKA